MTTLPEEAVKAAQSELSRIISEWERNREFLNASPDAKKNFMRRQASSLSALEPSAPDIGKPITAPSAAREQALEEAAQFIESHIYTSSPDGVRLVPSKRAGLDLHHQTIAAAIRALSSPDHADAGKVEGDVEKWSIREIVAKAIAYHSVGDPHARTIRGDQRWEWFVEEADKFISVFGYYLPAIPSAPASEGAE